jgi:hypothetical protein
MLWQHWVRRSQTAATVVNAAPSVEALYERCTVLKLFSSALAKQLHRGASLMSVKFQTTPGLRNLAICRCS